MKNTLRCGKCNGEGWIHGLKNVPAGVYGMPRQISFSRPCDLCRATGRVTIETLTDAKEMAARLEEMHEELQEDL